MNPTNAGYMLALTGKMSHLAMALKMRAAGLCDKELAHGPCGFLAPGPQYIWRHRLEAPRTIGGRLS